MRILVFQLSGKVSGNADLKRGMNLSIFSSWNTKFLRQGGASPLQPPPGGQPLGPPHHFFIVSRYSLPHDVNASWDPEKKNSIPTHTASILPSFQCFNALICNILIFGIIFDYDFLQFSINLWPESVTKRYQNGPGPSDCIQMSETSELPGASPPGPPPGPLPLDPTRGPTAGPWTPRQFTLLSLRSLRS